MLDTSGKTILEKILAVLLLLVILLTAGFLIDRVYLSGLESIKQDIKLKERKLVKISAILQKEDTIKKMVSREQSKSRQHNIFLSSLKPSTASSELQNKLKRLIATHSNGKILTIKPYPVVEHPHYMETSIEVRMRGVRHNELKNILFGIESGYPLLKTNQLDIKRSQLRYKTIVKGNQRADKLEVILLVSGFFHRQDA